MNKEKDFIEKIQFLDQSEMLVLNELLEIVFSIGFSKSEEIIAIYELKEKETLENTIIYLDDNTICKVTTFTIDSKLVIVVKKESPFASEQINDSFVNKIYKLIEHVKYDVLIIKDKNVIYRNHHLRAFLGLSLSNMTVSSEEFLSPSGYQKLHKQLDEKKDGILLLEVKNGFSDYVVIRVYLTYFSYMGHDYFISVNKSVEDIEKVEDMYIEELDYLRHAIASINEGVIILDKHNKVRQVNPSAQEIIGVSIKELYQEEITDYMQFFDSNKSIIHFLSEGNISNQEALMHRVDGMFWNVNLTVDDFYNDKGVYLGKVITLVNLSNVKKRENDILYLSYHDVLTGLYNRTFLEEEIKRLDTVRDLPFSIIMGDVNGLKITNDVFGHETGDELLKNIARVLKHTCREGDIIGRWGGDEFVILLPKTGNDEANQITKRIIRTFEDLDESYKVEGIVPSLSLGYGIKAFEEEDIFETLKEAEMNMYKRKMLTKDSMYSAILDSMKQALYEKSHETEEHAERLYHICLDIAKSYDLSNDEYSDLELFSMLHDVGKIGIPDYILNYPGKLTDEEMAIMRTHSEIGYRIAQQTPSLSVVANYILSHHERWDGLGYPRGLKGRQIPLLARILAVADAYDAMTNDRVYRRKLSKEEALIEIQNNSGSQFDPHVVEIFINLNKKK